MAFLIESLDRIPVLYFSQMGILDNSIAKAWLKIEAFICTHNIDDKKSRFFGILWNMADKTQSRYDACIKLTNELKMQSSIMKQDIPKGKYAKIEYQGPFAGALPYAKQKVFDSYEFQKQKDRTRPWVVIEYLNHEHNHGDRSLCKANVYFPIK